jgi:rod shape-determining protein MreD
MKRLFSMLLVLSVICATMTQALLPAPPWLGSARFPVLLGLALYYALNHKPWIALVVAFMAGILQDGLSLVPLGYSALLFCVVATIVGRYRRLVLSEAIVTAAFFGGVCSLGVTVLLYLFLKMNGAVACTGGVGLLRIVGSALLGLVTVPVVFVVMTVLHRSLNLLDEEESNARA